ncbi:TPA: hypothetical protein DIV55_04110 [Patescibacteria group bacterium]|nr:hypothetical protein [Patescibacteria group bacterium]
MAVQLPAVPSASVMESARIDPRASFKLPPRLVHTAARIPSVEPSFTHNATGSSSIRVAEVSSCKLTLVSTR